MNKITKFMSKIYVVEEKGSITVEAAFVMPIVVFTILALIYLAFYLHDYNRLQGTVDLVIHKAAIAVKHEADIATGQVAYDEINDRGVFYFLIGDTKVAERKINKLLEQELSKGLFITRVIKAEVEVGKLDIRIDVLADAQMDLPIFKNVFNKMVNIKIDESYPVHNPAETIRISEVILNTGSKIKGVDKLKDILNNFINKND